jgi:hypothetical protein
VGIVQVGGKAFCLLLSRFRCNIDMTLTVETVLWMLEMNTCIGKLFVEGVSA